MIDKIKSQPSDTLKTKLRKEYGLREISNGLCELKVDLFRLVVTWNIWYLIVVLYF